MLPSPSRGNFRTYFFRRTDGGGWEHDLNWNAVQSLPGKVRASLRVQETSTVHVPGAVPGQPRPRLPAQPLLDGHPAAQLRAHHVQLRPTPRTRSSSTRRARDPNTFDRRRHLPSLTVNMSPQKHRKTGLVFAYEARAESLAARQPGPHRQVRPLRPQPAALAPAVALLPPAHARRCRSRYTRYGVDRRTRRRARWTARSTGASTWRRSLEMRGPTFSRVFNTPGQLLLRPLQARDRARGDLDLPLEGRGVRRPSRSFDYLDYILGTNEVRYALVQRFYAKRPGRSGKLEPYEFLNWRVAQTYYVDIARRRRTTSTPTTPPPSSGAGGEPAHYSPLQSRLRFRPTPRRLDATSTWSTT